MRPASNFGASAEPFLRICQEAGYFLAERNAGQMKVCLNETLGLGVRLSDNISKRWRGNLKKSHLNAFTLNENVKSLVDFSGESFRERLRWAKDRAAGKETLEIAETYDVAGTSSTKEESVIDGLLLVQPDKVQRLTRTLFSSTAMRNENVLKVQRERKIWWMKVHSMMCVCSFVNILLTLFV